MDGEAKTINRLGDVDIVEEIKAMLTREHERTRRILTRIDECMTQLEKSAVCLKISY